MAKRLRQIVVDGVTCRWRFDGVLVVIPNDHSGPQLYFDWGWRDWLEPGEAGNEPRIATPQFVSAAVRFAMGMGWPSTVGGGPLRIGIVEGCFLMSTSDAAPNMAE